MKKREKNDIDFDFFVKLLTPFHPLMSSEVKYKMLFDIYDIGGVTKYYFYSSSLTLN